MSNLFDNLVARSAREPVIQPRIPTRYEAWEDTPDSALRDGEVVVPALPPREPPPVHPLAGHDSPEPGRITLPEWAMPGIPEGEPPAPRALAQDDVEPVVYEHLLARDHDTIIEHETQTTTAVERIITHERPIVDPAVPTADRIDEPAWGKHPIGPDNASGPVEPVPVVPAPVEQVPAVTRQPTPFRKHVSVSIGRIEVKLPQATPLPKPEMPKARPKRAFRPAMSLSDYMNKQRK
jgi:hypothetical protein